MAISDCLCRKYRMLAEERLLGYRVLFAILLLVTMLSCLIVTFGLRLAPAAPYLARVFAVEPVRLSSLSNLSWVKTSGLANGSDVRAIGALSSSWNHSRNHLLSEEEPQQLQQELLVEQEQQQQSQQQQQQNMPQQQEQTQQQSQQPQPQLQLEQPLAQQQQQQTLLPHRPQQHELTLVEQLQHHHHHQQQQLSAELQSQLQQQHDFAEQQHPLAEQRQQPQHQQQLHQQQQYLPLTEQSQRLPQHQEVQTPELLELNASRSPAPSHIWVINSNSSEPLVENLGHNYKLCSRTPFFQGLAGPLRVEKKKFSLDFLQAKFPYVQTGGIIKPADCVSDQRVALIIPFRNRNYHLHVLLNHLIPVLHRQQADIRIFVIEQVSPVIFNRAALFNVGFLESERVDNFDCYIFHDVDMLPLNDRNLYHCSENPRHFVSAIFNHTKHLPYIQYFGGVVGIRAYQYRLINGHSNLYFGWGAEDDDLLIRCMAMGLRIVRYPVQLGTYLSFAHPRDKGNEKNLHRFGLLRASKKRQHKDGLNTISYTVTATELKPLYTLVQVNLDQVKIMQEQALAQNASASSNKSISPAL